MDTRKVRWLAPIVATLMTASCASTDVTMMRTATAKTAGDAPAPGRTVGVSIDDAGTTLRVKGRLFENSMAKGLLIDVDTREGIVVLTGEVGSEKERAEAVELTRETEGVKDVQANLTIVKG